MSVDGTRSLFDQQIVQGTGRPWTNVALDSNAQLWAWGSRIDDESTLVFSQFPGDDEYTVQESLKAPAAIEHVAMDDTRIAWARDGATLKLADVATMSSEQTIDQSDEQDARFRVHLSDDTLVYVLTTRDRTTLNGVLLDGLNESQRWEPIDFGFERFIRVLDTRRNGDQVDVLLHVWNDRESSVEQRTFCFN